MKNLVRKWHSLLYHSKLYFSKKMPLLISPPTPRWIQLECTTKCNLKCIMCEYSYLTGKGEDLSFEKFRHIVDSFPNLRTIDMTGIGEAFLNRDFLRTLEHLKSKSINVTFNDNFTLLTPKIAEKLISMQIDEIVISLDGATKETYESIRVGANFEKVTANIKNLVKLKNKMNSELPKLGIICTISNENIHEAPLMVDLAKSLNCWLKLSNVKTFEETKKLSIDINDKKTKRIFEQTREKAREMGVQVSFRHFSKRPIQKCNYPWKTCYITYNGFVYPCSYITHSKSRESRVKWSFGNIFEADFNEIWRSKKAKKFREKIRKGKVPTICTDCQIFGPVNTIQ